jgi:hypothetical protein
MRILSESWSPARDALSVDVSGMPGVAYDLALWNPKQIRSMDGAELLETPDHGTVARVQLPAQPSGDFARATIIFHFF